MVRYIKCDRCGKEIEFKGGKHKYCAECLPIVRREKQQLRDFKKVVKHRIATAEKRHKVCPSCGVEFCSLTGTTKSYCGRYECEKYRRRLKNKRSDRNRIKRRAAERADRLNQFNTEHKVYVDFDATFNGIKYESCKGGKRFTLEYVNHCLTISGYKLHSKYINSTRLLELECPEGHLFKTSFGSFITKHTRCPVCKIQHKLVTVTKQEALVSKWLDEVGISYIYRDKHIVGKELDFYIPSKNVAIEVCGLYWHSEISGGKPRLYHRSKYDTCVSKGIRLITIFDDELNDRPEVVKSRVYNALGITSIRVYARKTSVCLISNSIASSFLNKYHLQGSSPATFSVGMYYDNRLIGVMTFGSMSRSHTKVDGSVPTFELKRFGFIPGYSVVGGASKLFKYAIRYIRSNYNEVEFIKSFCDLRYANPFCTVYDRLGFDLYNETKATPHYVYNHWTKRRRNQGLVKTIKSTTEWEQRKSEGFDRIWDCGHRSYVYHI